MKKKQMRQPSTNLQGVKKEEKGKKEKKRNLPPRYCRDQNINQVYKHISNFYGMCAFPPYHYQREQGMEDQLQGYPQSGVLHLTSQCSTFTITRRTGQVQQVKIWFQVYSIKFRNIIFFHSPPPTHTPHVHPLEERKKKRGVTIVSRHIIPNQPSQSGPAHTILR